MDMRRLVGRNVRRARQAAGLSQETLSERSGVSQQHLSTIETGRSNVTVVTLYFIAEQLGTTLAALVRPDEEALSEAPAAASPARRKL